MRYGDLQGLNKAETANKFGEEQAALRCHRRKRLGVDGVDGRRPVVEGDSVAAVVLGATSSHQGLAVLLLKLKRDFNQRALARKGI